jgi:iron uptake system component EfeO
VVVAFESSLPGYMAASFPTTMAQAAEFRDGLAMRLVSDAQAMRDMFKPLALDTASAFRGVIGSIAEQVEKITLASTGEEESRYSQHTLADMRANLEGGKRTYDSFRSWVRSISGGTDLDADIMTGFGRVETLYQGVTGEALPPVPDGFDPTAPTATQLATPYGVIFAGLSTEANPDDPNSLVSKMVAAADLLGIPELPQ